MEQRRKRLWKVVAPALSILALGCFLASVEFYYWPKATNVPRPDLGRTYVLNNHGSRLYLTRGEWRTMVELEIAAGVLFVLAMVIAYVSEGKMASLPKPKPWWIERRQVLTKTGGTWRQY